MRKFLSEGAETICREIDRLNGALRKLEGQEKERRGKDWIGNAEIRSAISRSKEERAKLFLQLVSEVSDFWECVTITNIPYHPWEAYEKLLFLADRENNFLYAQVAYEKLEYHSPYGTDEEEISFNAWTSIIEKTDFPNCPFGRQCLTGYHPRLIDSFFEYTKTIKRMPSVYPAGAEANELLKETRLKEAKDVREWKRRDRISDALKNLKSSRPGSGKSEEFMKRLKKYGFDPTAEMIEEEKLRKYY